MAPSYSPGDLDRSNVCEAYAPLVYGTVKRLGIVPKLWKDAVQEGMIGLLHASDHYDANSPVHFSVFARTYVKGAIIRGMFGKPEEATTIPVGALAEVYKNTVPLSDVIEEVEDRAGLHQWLDTLSPKDQWLIWRRYWQDATSAEVASELNTTTHWVNERHGILLKRAKSELPPA
jgi:RNA polymerase sigma factor (sigma-70 family)